MCLSIPGKVISIENNIAKVSVGGSELEAGLQLLDGVKVGEYVLVHSGFALQVISDEEAQEMLELIRAMENSADAIEFPGMADDSSDFPNEPALKTKNNASK